VRVGVGVKVGVGVGVGVRVGVLVLVGVGVRVGVIVLVGVTLGVFVRVGVEVGGIGVKVGAIVGNWVLVGVAVRVGVLVGVWVGVSVGSSGEINVNEYEPVPPTKPASVAIIVYVPGCEARKLISASRPHPRPPALPLSSSWPSSNPSGPIRVKNGSRLS